MESLDSSGPAFERFHAYWEIVYRGLMDKVPPYLEIFGTFMPPKEKELISLKHHFPETDPVNVANSRVAHYVQVAI
jgi:hypothetical protein